MHDFVLVPGEDCKSCSGVGVARGRLFFFFEFDDDDFDGVGAGVDVGMLRARRIRGEPVGLAGFPGMLLGCALVVDDLHVAAAERHEDARVVVAVEGERRMGKDDGLPDADVFVFKLRETLRLRGRLLRADASRRSEDKDGQGAAQKEGCGVKFHRGSPGEDGSTRQKSETRNWKIEIGKRAGVCMFSWGWEELEASHDPSLRSG